MTTIKPGDDCDAGDTDGNYLNACHGDVSGEYQHEGQPQQENIHLDKYRHCT